MRPAFFILFSIIGILLFPEFAIAQDENTEAKKSGAFNIYIDCPYCDYDYLRTEISYVNFVRDRKQADVHILVSAQETGSGGNEYTIELIGRNQFDNMTDTLIFYSQESDSEDHIRKGLKNKISLGLIRYAACTPAADDIVISHRRKVVDKEEQEVRDKWNYWVFEFSLDTWLNGEQTYRAMNIWVDIEARRVTKDLRLEFDIYNGYYENKFDYEEYDVLSISRNKGAGAVAIFSVTDQWSAGLFTSITSSDYSNMEFKIWIAPTIEYNIFPYSESTRRELRIFYRISTSYSNYFEETIYNETTEWLYSQRLGVTLGMVQPWGSASATVSGSHYFHDFSKKRISIHSDLSLRLIEGLSLNLYGNFAWTHDLIYIKKGTADPDDVYLRRQALETSYQYYLSVGMSYTFGSIYNNIVNPRFGY
ncbi:MAG: hypothetical protein GWO41_16435 [candidate division Zixibacteria bacterium]|nr:hypothetical protein [candidate division Zixibacteria bacterium]NIR66377.1 hypothetical protein [candidate division Zixibacteria bacterium]NIS17998.1 hypothetical protein [candidate division Zixibacteria bacterium]NIS47979.1 hypothetical protein [candidate division Zixibacteria bacterium]NIT54281.1 hypothetical protein [candidate division Zixibacteria bacterium]